MSVTWTRLTGPGTAEELRPQLAHAREQSILDFAAKREVRSAVLPLPLGDVVERYAKPIAWHIDLATWDLSALLGCGRKYATRFAAGCSACSKRRAYLNLVVRNVRNWREWVTAWRRVRPAWRTVYGCSKRAGKTA